MQLHINFCIDELKLQNKSATVCQLRCHYKVNQDGERKRAGESGYFPVEQSKTLDLNSLQELLDLEKQGKEVWVTAQADIKAAGDEECGLWFRFKSNSNAQAYFKVIGTSGLTDLGLFEFQQK